MEERGFKKGNNIRVKLSFSGNQAQITSSQDFHSWDSSTGNISQYLAGELLNINGIAEGQVIRVRAREGVLEVKNWEHRPMWNPELNDNLYREVLEIRKESGRLILINELPLEDYLKGIAEVIDSEPEEKLKTLAVLARTYAQYYLEKDQKFPDKPYDASDDPDVFQKYLGYGYELRAPYSWQAVMETEGEVVTYQGELVKTPYFNESDGRTRSAEEVWSWTNTPYLQSVDDTYCKNGQGTLLGHGVGLSGCGAAEMAREGSSYEEIIRYYYRGVEISSL